MSSQNVGGTNPHFSVLALLFFIVFFLVARIFTTLSPGTVILVGGGIHIHHFWFGLAFLAVGGWMGIINQNQRIDQLAAVLYGAGGGLIADEVGLLLTFGDYWTELTYTLVIVFLTLVSIGILLAMYSDIIRTQFWGLSRSSVAIYLAVFLAVVSVVFLLETNNIVIVSIAVGLAILAGAMVLAYSANWYRLKHAGKRKKPISRKRGLIDSF